MNDSTFDQALDALVMGQEPEQPDDLTLFVAGLYRKEHDVNMPVYRRTQLASALGGGGTGVAIGLPTAYPGRKELGRNRSRRFTWLAVAAAMVLAMTGLINWGLPNGDDDNRFLGVPSAIPTVQATPVASTAPNADWLKPISANDCALSGEPFARPTNVAMSWGDFPSRVYEPLQLANEAARTDAWNAAREMRSCLNTVGVETFWSDRLWYEETDRVFSVSPEARQLQIDQIVHGQQVTDFYLNQLGVTPDQMVLRFEVGDAEVDGLDPGTYAVINPDWIVQTADGRQIVLVTAMVVTDGEMPLVTPDTSQPGGLAWVLIQNDGVWQIDEGLPVCIGTEEVCAPFWQQQPGWSAYVEMRMPVSSPGLEVASPHP